MLYDGKLRQPQLFLKEVIRMDTRLIRASVLCGIAGTVIYGLLAALPVRPLSAAPLPADDDPTVSVSDNAKGVANTRNPLLLRPNLPHSIHLIVENPTTQQHTLTTTVKVS